MVDQINHHLYRKRGFYYFSRRVPKALLDDYPKSRIVLALKTRHYRDALRQSQILSKRLDDQWFHMQLDAMGLDNVQAKVFQTAKGAAPLMSEATVFCMDTQFYLSNFFGTKTDTCLQTMIDSALQKLAIHPNRNNIRL